MPSYTSYYNLTKPATTDAVDITVLNDNFDAIDAQMKANADAAEEAAEALPAPATVSRAGIVKPDGTTITVDADGTIHGVELYVLPAATAEALGGVKVDGTTITVDADGTIHGVELYVLPAATANTLGGIKVGNNLSIDANGVLHAFASIETDPAPVSGSSNVPLSGGTYSMIDSYASQVNTLDTTVQALISGLNWLAAVSTYSDIATTYPSPSSGDTVTCLDNGHVWRYDGTNWVFIFIADTVDVLTAAEVMEILEL